MFSTYNKSVNRVGNVSVLMGPSLYYDSKGLGEWGQKMMFSTIYVDAGWSQKVQKCTDTI